MRAALDVWQEGTIPKETIRQTFQGANPTVRLPRGRRRNVTVTTEAFGGAFDRRDTHLVPATLDVRPTGPRHLNGGRTSAASTAR